MTILDFIFPKQCVSCGAIGRYVCKRCVKQMNPIATNECICPMCEKPAIAGKTHPRCQTRFALDGLTSFFYYKNVVKKIITSIKYSFVRDMAQEFASYVPYSGYTTASLIGNADAMLVPIPLHATRFRFRGFNQSDVLGSCVARHLRIQYSSGVLTRIRATNAQVSMKHKVNRLTNVRHAFALGTSPISLSGKTILLFDDVFTTGATLREAGNVLKRNGATCVWGITMAR